MLGGAGGPGGSIMSTSSAVGTIEYERAGERAHFTNSLEVMTSAERSTQNSVILHSARLGAALTLQN